MNPSPCRMQFSHVSDMATEEIMDYAVLYGDTANDLKIKSFSHLQVRDYAEADWISIFIDLMVDIFDVENPFALRNHLNTKGAFNRKMFTQKQCINRVVLQISLTRSTSLFSGTKHLSCSAIPAKSTAFHVAPFFHTATQKRWSSLRLTVRSTASSGRRQPAS